MDGTSIWAAATSGMGPIGVRLLACMLAQIWTQTETTSIWVQIIEGRRQEIATRSESGPEMRWQTFNAARPESKSQSGTRVFVLGFGLLTRP